MKQRLFFISGKGGVGKTIFSLSLTQFLKSQGKKVLYSHFDQEPPIELCESLGIPFINLTDEECLKVYINKKLNSKIIGNWVVKTPFFHSLFNILPGFKNLVYIGYLINLLIEDPKLSIILDSPSSGHALTLLESPSNFREILKTGPLVKDINIIETKLKDPEFVKMFILFLPTTLAFHEAEELREGVLSLKLINPELVMNNSFLKIKSLGADIPPFLKEKFILEKNLLTDYQEKYGDLKKIIPHIPQNNKNLLVKQMVKSMEEFNG